MSFTLLSLLEKQAGITNAKVSLEVLRKYVISLLKKGVDVVPVLLDII